MYDIEALKKIPDAWDSLGDQEKRLILKYLDEIEDELLDWKPLPGPQTQAYYSSADILFYGGAAGGGKTDLILGLAHKEHRRSVIFRREYTQLKGIIERGKELFVDRKKGKFNKVTSSWRLNDGRLIELGACKDVGDEERFQGIPHDLKAFDEITHYHEAQFRFLIGWLRSTNSNQRKRVVCAGNPPTTAEGDWVIKYWGPWLDDKHLNPALPGELRFYTTINGEDVEVPNGEPFEHEGEMITPRSRTFIPAQIEDNPYLIEAGYKATLQSLPEPLRSKMLYGSFTAGREDDAWQIIPTEWVLMAQARWKERPKPQILLTALGVDVARGGADKTIITPRYGNWFDRQICHPGSSTPDGKVVAALVAAEVAYQTQINVDVIGVGSSVYDVLTANNLNVFPIDSASGSDAVDKSGKLAFRNKRAEMWWKMREALDPYTGEKLALPDDRELLADLTAPRWKLSISGIQVESKDDIRKRIGRSPDKGDSAVYALVGPQNKFSFTSA